MNSHADSQSQHRFHKKDSIWQTKTCKAGSILLLSKVARSKKTRCICASVRIHTQCEQMANMEKNCCRNTNVLTGTKVKTQAWWGEAHSEKYSNNIKPNMRKLSLKWSVQKITITRSTMKRNNNEPKYALNFHLKCSKGNKASSYQTAEAEKTYCEAAVL